MGRIVAISGGDLSSTKALNQYALRLTGKEDINVLFVGTASRDAEGYIENILRAYWQLDCQVRNLSLVTNQYTQEELEELLNWADVIYVGGGDTISMMKVWKEYGLDQKLREIYKKDSAVLTGISAGAICWFTCGHSDSEAFSGKEDWAYTWAEGMLDFHHAAFCPHYNEEGRDSFDKMLSEKMMPGIALENDTAFVEVNGKVSFIKCNDEARGYAFIVESGQLEKRELEIERIL